MCWGISASTLFKAAIIPGLLILLSILVTNIIVSRKMAKAEGQLMSFGEWAANLGRVLGKGWYAFMIPGIIFFTASSLVVLRQPKPVLPPSA